MSTTTSVRKRRTSLEALLRPVEPAPPPPPVHPVAVAPATLGAAGTPVKKRPVRQQTAYLPVPVHEQLRRLAFEERVKMHTLLMEGLDRVFRDRGLPGLDELGGGEDDGPG